MRRFVPFVALSIAVVLCAVVRAEDKKENKDPKARKVDPAKIAEAGPGVYNIEFDAKGRITSLLVVGTARISTVLGAAKGKEVARTRASLACDAEFVKFLKSEVKAYEKTEDETVIFLEGNEGNDKDAMNESGKSIEKTSVKLERSAQGMIRGMQVAYVETSEKEKTYYLVKRWRAKTSAGAAKLEEDLKDGKKKDGDKKSKPEDKKIGDKKIIIDD